MRTRNKEAEKQLHKATDGKKSSCDMHIIFYKNYNREQVKNMELNVQER